MSDESTSRDWSDPFGPSGGRSSVSTSSGSGRGPVWVVSIGVIVVAVVVAVFLLRDQFQQPNADRTIVVGLPETTSVVVQIDVSTTLVGLDDVLEMDASGLLQKMLELAEHREGISLSFEHIEYLVAAVDQPTWLLSELPQDEWVDSMLFFVRFKEGTAGSDVLPPGTPTVPVSDGSMVYQVDRLVATAVDDRTWLVCPQNLLTVAKEAYQQQTQPAWMANIESTDSVIVAGKFSGMTSDNLTEEIELFLSGSFGRPCRINGSCTTPQLEQAQQLLRDLEQLLNREYNGRGPIRDSFFDQADLALSGRTVTFEGTVAAEEVKLAMAPVTMMIGLMGLASIAEVPEEPSVREPLPEGIPDNPTNQRCWELLQMARANSWRTEVVEENMTELLSIEDAPPEFVAEARMMLCNRRFDNRDEHFEALRQMDDVPSQMMAEACREMLFLEFDEEAVIEYCTLGLECEGLSSELAAEFYIKRGRAYLPSSSFGVAQDDELALAYADAESALALDGIPPEWQAEALDLRARAGRDLDQQIADYRAALAITDWDAFGTLGRLHALLREENNLDLAIECMTAVIDNEQHRPSLRTEATVIRGDLKKDLDDIDGFLADNWLVVEGEYDSRQTSEALDRITLHYFEAGDLQAALDACTRAIAAHPAEASFEVDVIESRANIFLAMDNYAQALAEFELVRAKNPYRDLPGRDRLARAWLGSAQALMALNRAEEALVHLQSGIEVFDADDDVTADLLNVRIARALLNRQWGNDDAAVQELEEVLALSQFRSITESAQTELDAIRGEQPPN